MNSLESLSAPRIPMPKRVLGVSHYYQRAGLHPNPTRTPCGVQRVELMTGGRGWVEHEGDWVEVKPGQLIWEVEGDSTIGRSDFENPYRCLSIIFEVEKRGFRRPVSWMTEWPDLVAVRQFTDELVRTWVERSIPPEIFTAYAYSRLLIQALKGEERSEREGLPPGLRRARNEIEERFASRLSVAKLAALAECSEPYLHELFQQHMGESPYQMILKCRLKEAARRLTSTNDPIKRIAGEVGFTHTSAFCHAFRKFSGHTPAIYRRRAHTLMDVK